MTRVKFISGRQLEIDAKINQWMADKESANNSDFHYIDIRIIDNGSTTGNISVLVIYGQTEKTEKFDIDKRWEPDDKGEVRYGV